MSTKNAGYASGLVAARAALAAKQSPQEPVDDPAFVAAFRRAYGAELGHEGFRQGRRAAQTTIEDANAAHGYDLKPRRAALSWGEWQSRLLSDSQLTIAQSRKDPSKARQEREAQMRSQATGYRRQAAQIQVRLDQIQTKLLGGQHRGRR